MAATIPTNGIVLSSGLNVADGDITLASGHGISFAATGDGTNDDSELFDDFEEGTWTPVLGDTSGNNFTLNSSYSSFGYYTKVGRIVTAHTYIICTAINSASGSCRLSGLPFTNTDNSRAITGGSVGYVNGCSLGDGKSLGFYVATNATSGFLFNHNNADGGATATCANIGSSGEFMMNVTYTIS